MKRTDLLTGRMNMDFKIFIFLRCCIRINIFANFYKLLEFFFVVFRTIFINKKPFSVWVFIFFKLKIAIIIRIIYEVPEHIL